MVLEETQSGVGGGHSSQWNVYDRGLELVTAGPEEDAKALGINPVSSSPTFDHEAVYHGQYRRWLELVGSARLAKAVD